MPDQAAHRLGNARHDRRQRRRRQARIADPSSYLTQAMSVQRLTEILASLDFNRQRQSRLVVDPSVRTFLLKATQAAAADLSELTIRQALNRHVIRPPR
jgi:hypothetical protein